MKKLLLGIIVAGMMATTVAADDAVLPWTIGGGSTGYGASAMDKGAHFNSYWAGLRAKHMTEKSALYGMYQHVAVDGGVSADGAKLMLISGSEKVPWLYLMADVGFAFSLAENADGSMTAGLTSGGGFAVTLSEMLAPFVYASAIDTFAFTDMQSLLGLDL